MPISSITQQLLRAAERSHRDGVSPLVILDLDGTLYDSTVRTWRILQEFAHRQASTNPETLRRLKHLEAAQITYTVEDSLARVGITNGPLVEEAVAFWQQRFFTDEYVQHDLPTPGAVSFVRLLCERGVVPVYLTGRPAPTMLVGTIRALQRDGFPIGTANTRLVLKDDVDTPDEHYKQSVLTVLQESGNVIGAFDNEPGLCNLFERTFPQALVVHLNTTHSPQAPPLDAGIEQVPNFVPST